MTNGVSILIGDALTHLRSLPDASVHCCVTSPPYYGLRSYMPDGVQIKRELSDSQKQEIINELRQLGIKPLDHTTE